MTTAEMLLRLGAGVGLGALIGLERQYRARMAGLQTNALVAAGATLFVLLSAHGFSGATADPTRVAAQIVSGIGFLGAGVILRDGRTVSGLSTAATLCCSPEPACSPEAAAGTVAVLTVHMMLRPLGLIVDRQPATGTESPATYVFQALANEESEAHVHTVLVDVLSRTEFALQSVASTHNGTPGQVEVCAALTHHERDDKRTESAVSRLSFEPSVISVRWQVDEPGATEQKG